MKTVREVSVIPCTPAEVWRFLTTLDHDAYLRWHPRDHLDFRRLKAPLGPTGVGQVMVFKERLGRRAFQFSCVVSESVEDRYVEFMPRRPLALLRLGSGYFRIEPVSGGRAQLEAVVELGWRSAIAGRALDWLIGKVVDLSALHAHMQEEARYLPDAAKSLMKPRPETPRPPA